MIDADYNDLGFSVGNRLMVLVESQATWSENDIIGQYILFCRIYNEQRRRYGNTKQAVTETIRICKDRNVLKEYLESGEQEVVDIMMTLFGDEQILKAYAKEIADNTARETEKKTARETAEGMIKKGR